MTDHLERLGRELTVAIDDQVRAEHLAALTNALSIHGVDDFTAVPAAAPRSWARRLAGAATLSTLVAVPSAALAQDALPGDALHGIKLAVEHVQQLVNPDIRAVHRLEELEVLLNDASTDEVTMQLALGNAIAATSASQASDHARARLAELTERAEARRAAGKPGVGPEAGADDDGDGDADAPGKSGEPHGKAHQERGEADDDEADATSSEPTDDASDGATTPDDDATENDVSDDDAKPDAPGAPKDPGAPGHSNRPTSQNPGGQGQQPSSSGGTADLAGS